MILIEYEMIRNYEVFSALPGLFLILAGDLCEAWFGWRKLGWKN
jgi:hypothetical protein